MIIEVNGIHISTENIISISLPNFDYIYDIRTYKFVAFFGIQNVGQKEIMIIKIEKNYTKLAVNENPEKELLENITKIHDFVLQKWTETKVERIYINI